MIAISDCVRPGGSNFLERAWLTAFRLGSVVLCAGLLVCIQGCYSFTGASVPPHLKTIAVPMFDDQTGMGEPDLGKRITEKLIDRFNHDNNLQVADRSRADAMIEGVIVSMTDAPSVVSAGENVTARRITLNIKVVFRDMKLKKQVWEKQLSNFGDYSAGANIVQRRAAIDVAIDKLTEDLVLDTVSGW